MIRIIKSDGNIEKEYIAVLSGRDSSVNESVNRDVAQIIADVRKDGDSAVDMYSKRFGDFIPEKTILDRIDLKEAFLSIDSEFREALIRASDNIKDYHKKQVTEGYESRKDDGTVIGQRVIPLHRVGVYVPGGTAAYPSTVLMNVIPAKIAGCSEVIMATPARVSEGNDVLVDYNVLAAAFIAGVDRVYLRGGAQAIAAMAYGTQSLLPVDKIVGPGNIFVATAKRQVFGQVDIDMIAGPSEILVMADETANPMYVAADLLSQAEHDPMSASILLTTSRELADAVAIAVEKQLIGLKRENIARSSIEKNGLIIVVRSHDEMIKLSDLIAPEHLEIMTKNPQEALNAVRNAGSVFLGAYSPEPLGDYYSGTNHVLPTSGTARFASPLGVYDFFKRMSYTCYTKSALAHAKDDIINIGSVEGLTAHVNAVKLRFE